MIKTNNDETVGAQFADHIGIKKTVYTDVIEKLVAELRENWDPKMRTLKGSTYKGKLDVVEPYDILFWDVITLTWTHRQAAFKSYVFKELEKFIKY